MINTTIISPRRWGKSSLVEHVTQRFKKEHKEYRFVLIDLFTVYSEAQFLQLFAREVIKASSTLWNEWIKTAKNIFKRLIPKMTISLDPAQFSLEFDWDEIKKHREEILNLPELLAKQKKIKIVVCIDEFQNIRNFDKDHQLEKALRSYWQRHKNVMYCLYGSKRHMMSDIFDDPSRPFYRFGDILHLPKISKKDWVSFIQRKFKQTKKAISAHYASEIALQMNNHSWYTQQLAHFIWLRTDKEVDEGIFHRAFEELLATHLPFFEQTIDHLSRTQVNLLKAVAAGESRMTSQKVMQSFKMGTPNNVRKNLKALIDRDVIDQYQDAYIFLDPVFEIWFRQRVYNY